MSILRKIPKIEQVLDNMSIESLKRLESLMNSGNGATDTYTLFGGENKLNYENKDLGVWYCNIELERNKSVETGFLIWESQTKALFISYDITQCLKEYEIDLTTYTYVKINEKLSIEEFRRVLEDNINKEVVHIDTTGNVEVGKNLVVDGKVILNGKEDLVDTSGNELISGGGSDGAIDLSKYINLETNSFISSKLRSEFIEEVKKGISVCYFTFPGENIMMFFNIYLYNDYISINRIEDTSSYSSDNYTITGIYETSMFNYYISDNLQLIQAERYFYTFPSGASPYHVIPSVDTEGKQQNLTVGDGLEIENGVLKTNNIPALPSDASTKTYTLKAVNGVLTWVEG